MPDTAHQRCYVLLIQPVLLEYTDLLLIYSLEYLDIPAANRETELIPVDLDAVRLVDVITHKLQLNVGKQWKHSSSRTARPLINKIMHNDHTEF